MSKEIPWLCWGTSKAASLKISNLGQEKKVHAESYNRCDCKFDVMYPQGVSHVIAVTTNWQLVGGRRLEVAHVSHCFG